MTLRTLLVKLGFKGDITKVVDFDKKIKGLTSSVVGLTAMFASLTAGIGYFLNEAAKLEQTKIAFEVMTGSVEMGQKLIKDLFTYARTTPFQIPGVLQASKILLAMGITAENQIEALTKIGHVAAGIGKPLDQLASIFGRVKAAGYLTGYEMERLRRAGVPLGEYLSQTLKRPENEILTMIRRKEISFEMFQKGWETMVEQRFPNLMGRLLTTFHGIMSNIKDYIYEIVAFSGEELLPIAKQIASQMMYMLESSRKLISLKFKDFFGAVSGGLALLNKLFIRSFYRIREVTTQLGGFNRLFKIFGTIFGALVGVRSLTLLGKLGKMSISFFSPLAVKLALVGASIILILAVTEDLLGYLSGKESMIGRILDKIEKKFPTAFEHIMKWLGVLKKEIEGLTLLGFGLFEGLTTGDWSMAKAGAEQVSEAWQMAFKKVETQKLMKKSPLGEEMGLYGSAEVEAETLAGMGRIERMIARSKMLRDWAKKVEKAKFAVDEWFAPGGQRIEIDTGSLGGTGKKPAMEVFDLSGIRASMNRGLLSDENLRKKEREIDEFKLRISGGRKEPVRINNVFNIKDLPPNANSKEVAQELTKVFEPLFQKQFDKILTSGKSAVEKDQY